MLFPFIFCFLCLCQNAALALRNVTVQNDDGRIVYKPKNWTSYSSTLDHGGSHSMSTTKGATASFNFTGVGIYYLAPLWPYNVSTIITLDGSDSYVDLRDYDSTFADGGSASAPATTRWHRSGLNNETHTIIISIPDNGTYAIFNAFNYTVEDGTTVTDGDDNSTTNNSLQKNTSSSIWPIIAGSVGGGLVLIGALLAVYFLYYRRKKRTQKEPTHTVESYPLMRAAAESAITVPMSRQTTVSSEVLFSVSERSLSVDHTSATSAPQFAVGSSSGIGQSRATSTTSSSRVSEKRSLVLTNAEPEPLPPPAYTEKAEI